MLVWNRIRIICHWWGKKVNLKMEVTRKQSVAEFYAKRIFLTPWYRGKKFSFLGKFVVLCFLVTFVLRFALLPYHWRTENFLWINIITISTIFCQKNSALKFLSNFSFEKKVQLCMQQLLKLYIFCLKLH